MSTAIVDRQAAALKRAAAAKLFAYKLDADTYEVPSNSMPGQMHLVRRIVGDTWSCTCAGSNHATCMHRQVVIYAATNGIRASRSAAPRPTPRCQNCGVDRAEPGRPYCAPCAHVLANREIAPVKSYEGAEKALRTPVATSITRVVVKGDVFGDWA